MVGGELAEEEGDPHGKEDEEEASCVHDLGLRVLRRVLQDVQYVSGLQISFSKMFWRQQITPLQKREVEMFICEKRQLYLSPNVKKQNISLTPAMFDQIIFSRWPIQAAATAKARMAEPKY